MARNKKTVLYDELIGTIIQLKRKERQLIQSELAALIKLSTSTMHRIEAGDSSLTVVQFNNVAAALGYSPLEFFELVMATSVKLKRAGIEVVYQGVPRKKEPDTIMDVIKASL